MSELTFNRTAIGVYGHLIKSELIVISNFRFDCMLH